MICFYFHVNKYFWDIEAQEVHKRISKVHECTISKTHKCTICKKRTSAQFPKRTSAQFPKRTSVQVQLPKKCTSVQFPFPKRTSSQLPKITSTQMSQFTSAPSLLSWLSAPMTTWTSVQPPYRISHERVHHLLVHCTSVQLRVHHYCDAVWVHTSYHSRMTP